MLAAHLAHLGEGGIADMRIVRPDNSLGLRSTLGKQAFERVEHMLVAQIPRRSVAVIDGAVILLGAGHDARILLGVEKGFAVLGERVEALTQEIGGGGYSSSNVTVTRASTVVVPNSMGTDLASIAMGAGEA